MNKTWITIALVFMAAAPTAAQPIDLWNSPRAEAEYLAVKVTGELRPPIPFTNEIEVDLAAIRTAFPVVAELRPNPDWMPGEVALQLTPQAFAEFRNGTFTGFDPLFSQLGTPQIQLSLYPDMYRNMTFSFGQVYHGERLSELFRDVDGVEYAQANWTVGDGDDILVEAGRIYTISHGYGDCPAGCTEHEAWRFAVTDDAVAVLSHENGSQEFIWPPNVPEPPVTASMFTLLAIWFGRASRTPRRKV